MRLRRLAALVALCALLAPGTWLRTDIITEVPRDIALGSVAGAAATLDPAWRLEGVWEYTTGPTRKFGGFSAMFTLGDNHLRAFSDRGYRFTFPTPDQAEQDPAERVVSRQPTGSEALNWDLWDIEAATRDPANGDYWLAYEYVHAINRFTIASEPTGLKTLADEVNWPINQGLEAMVRLADGRFLAIPEGRAHVLIYPADPVGGAAPSIVPLASPAPEYAVTDMAQMPDGRILLLMRKVSWDDWSWPPFSSLLAIAEPPVAGEEAVWRPMLALSLDGVVPAENYEALAVRPQADGTFIIWILSDDNIAALQRTLLAKLVFDPAAIR